MAMAGDGGILQGHDHRELSPEEVLQLLRVVEDEVYNLRRACKRMIRERRESERGPTVGGIPVANLTRGRAHG